MRNVVLGGVAIWALAACMPQSLPTQASSDPVAVAEDEEVEFTNLEPRDPADSKLVNFEDNEKKGNAERGFSYAWPTEVNALPKLAALMTEMRDDALRAQKTEWEQSVAEYGTDNCITCVSRDFATTWEVAADTPRFLSLGAGVYVYGGGAHGNTYFDTLVWDREAGAAMGPVEMFSSQDALWSAISDDYCAGLNEERAKRRGGPVTGSGWGSNCPGLDELVVVATSSNGKTFDRLELLAAPYVAGAYAEGSFEVTVPLTQAALAAAKPEYRAYFSLGS